MKRHLLAIALLGITAVTTIAALPNEDKRAHFMRLRSERPNLENGTLLDRAYLDVLQLLEQPGTCGEFFGGDRAQVVLDRLVIQLREKRIADSHVGMQMYGNVTGYSDKGIRYRLFESASLNTTGPFSNVKVFAAEPHIPNVGTFRPNTRAARALILLHELAHLIERNDGAWLIPDDGNNPQLSRKNTRTIEERCGAQIQRL
jgi:hypothetical protein